MTSPLGSVDLHVTDIDRAAAFWGQALGSAPDPANPAFLEWNYPDDAEFVVLEDTEGNVFCLVAAPSGWP